MTLDISAANTPILDARKVTCRMGNQLVLREIDFQLHAGEIVALLGGNGSGKTTLIKCLAGLLRPTAGDVRWFGQVVSRRTALHRHVGVVGHESFLYGELTARDNLQFAARMYGIAEARGRVEELLNAIGLGHYANHCVGKLSKGTRQRLSIARAIVHQPPILLFDEPFSGLDPSGCEWLEELLESLRVDGRAICFTTHDESLARRLANRVLRLQAGQLLEDATIGATTFSQPRFCRSA